MDCDGRNSAILHISDGIQYDNHGIIRPGKVCDLDGKKINDRYTHGLGTSDNPYIIFNIKNPSIKILITFAGDHANVFKIEKQDNNSDPEFVQYIIVKPPPFKLSK